MEVDRDEVEFKKKLKGLILLISVLMLLIGFYAGWEFGTKYAASWYGDQLSECLSKQVLNFSLFG